VRCNCLIFGSILDVPEGTEKLTKPV